MQQKEPSGLDIQTCLIGRAATDANFRQQLLTNARAAIEKELGIALPDDLEIQVIEETPNRLCLVLPMKQEARGQLSDAALKSVAAGTLPIPLPMVQVADLPGPMPRPVAAMPEPIPTPVYSYDRLSIYRR
jgi:hypothetical protein